MLAPCPRGSVPQTVSYNSFRPAPQIPQSSPQGGWGRCSSRQLWHDPKSHLSQSKSVTSLPRVKVQDGRHAGCHSQGGASCSTWGCPLPTGLVRSTERRKPHPNPASSHSQREARHSGLSGPAETWPSWPSSLHSVPREAAWCETIAA